MTIIEEKYNYIQISIDTHNFGIFGIGIASKYKELFIDNKNLIELENISLDYKALDKINISLNNNITEEEDLKFKITILKFDNIIKNYNNCTMIQSSPIQIIENIIFLIDKAIYVYENIV